MRLPIGGLLAGAAARHGHHHLQRRGHDVPQQRQLAQRAGDHRERDVVERGLARALDLEQVRDRERVADERAARADRVVEERGRRGARDVLADRHRRAAQRAAEAPGRAGGARGAAERPQRLGAGVRPAPPPRAAPRRAPGQRAADPARAARAPPDRGRAAAARRRARTCRRPARDGSSSAARRCRPRAAARGGSPTAAACGRAGATARCRRARRSAPPSSGPLGEREHVPPDVEALGVDPHRVREPPGREGEALAEARGRVQPRGDLRLHARERDRRPRRDRGGSAPARPRACGRWRSPCGGRRRRAGSGGRP